MSRLDDFDLDDADEVCSCPDCEEDANGGGIYCEVCSQIGCDFETGRCDDDEHGDECRCPDCCDRRAGAADQARDAERDA